MDTVKIRHVGNSNVISLPRDLERQGFVEGTSVVLVPLRTGDLLVVPESRIEAYIDEVVQQQVARHRESLEKLAAYDRASEDADVTR
jgi:antitoxin component of MazEF toxin-antitoxin module